MTEVVLDLIPVLLQRACHAFDRCESATNRPTVPGLEFPPRRPRRPQLEDRHCGFLEPPGPGHALHALAQLRKALCRRAREVGRVAQPIKLRPLEGFVTLAA